MCTSFNRLLHRCPHLVLHEVLVFLCNCDTISSVYLLNGLHFVRFPVYTISIIGSVLFFPSPSTSIPTWPTHLFDAVSSNFVSFRIYSDLILSLSFNPSSFRVFLNYITSIVKGHRLSGAAYVSTLKSHALVKYFRFNFREFLISVLNIVRVLFFTLRVDPTVGYFQSEARFLLSFSDYKNFIQIRELVCLFFFLINTSRLYLYFDMYEIIILIFRYITYFLFYSDLFVNQHWVTAICSFRLS